MPEIGGKSIAAEFSLGIAGIKKVADALKLKAAGAVTEFMAEAKNLDKAADRVISEASEMRRAAAEILGNEVETTTEQPKPQATTTGGNINGQAMQGFAANNLPKT